MTRHGPQADPRRGRPSPPQRTRTTQPRTVPPRWLPARPGPPLASWNAASGWLMWTSSRRFIHRGIRGGWPKRHPSPRPSTSGPTPRTLPQIRKSSGIVSRDPSVSRVPWGRSGFTFSPARAMARGRRRRSGRTLRGASRARTSRAGPTDGSRPGPYSSNPPRWAGGGRGSARRQG